MTPKLLLSVLALVAISNALRLPCGVPFSMDNSTLQKLQNYQEGSVDLGSADLFWSPDGPKLWTRDRERLVTIQYCYKHPITGLYLRQYVENAIREWYIALGGPASAHTGHGLVFKEARNRDTSEPEFCHQDGTNNYWNPRLRYDTLVIDKVPELYGASSSVGLLQGPGVGIPWMNQLRLGQGITTRMIMHELGHTLGMVHEQNRPDRDRFVRYTCNNLRDYDTAIETAEPQHRHLLCTDIMIALKYGFSGMNYMAGVSVAGVYDASYPVFSVSAEYDFRSIMGYSTNVGSVWECEDDIDRCALVKYTDPEHHERGVERMIGWADPSRGDVDWIKERYPWRDPP